MNRRVNDGRRHGLSRVERSGRPAAAPTFDLIAVPHA
jgi:hypothetical protein